MALAPLMADAPYPPPGELIDVGGYRVHLYCTGSGAPTVMIAGAGYSFDWALVQPEVAKFTRVCTYDVSGTAWSEPGPPLTCPSRIEELHRLMTSPGMKSPFVLTGFSVGALLTRVYATRYPREVAGMVIVDHAFTDVALPLGPVVEETDLDSPPVLLEQTPITFTVEETSDFARLPERSRQLHRWADSLKPELHALQTAEQCLSELQNPVLGNLPLAVVSTTNGHPNYGKLQKRLLALSTRSRQFIADRSFHSVEIDRPEIVVDAIRYTVDLARQH